MELTEFETELIEKFRAYDSTLDPYGQNKAAESLIGHILTRFCLDDLQSIWYGVKRERTEPRCWLANWSTCDIVTKLGLRELIMRWADSESPTVVQVERD